MAESYANVVQTNLSRNSKPPYVQDPIDDEIDNPNTVKPVGTSTKRSRSIQGI
jgi:hypothetical protein